jgi:hypothetical protein
MVALIAWFMISYGLMNIMVYGSIFPGLRNKINELGNNQYTPFKGLFKFISGILSCPMCFSTWGGFFLGIFIVSPTNYLFGTSVTISWFFDGLLSSGAVWAINAIVEWFEQNRPK